MNHITYNQSELVEKFGIKKSLGEIFEALEKELSQKGQIVCQFKVNGLALSEGDEARFSAMATDGVDQIEVSINKPSDLLFDLLHSWSKELPQLIVAADELAKEIKFKGVERHLKSLVDLVESCQFLVESLISLRSLIHTNQEIIQLWTENESMTARAIRDTLKAFQDKDFVLLAEILEYDLGHSLQVWQDVINELRVQLKEEYAQDSIEFEQRIFKKQAQPQEPSSAD